jgi:hypothetical protein
MNKSRVFDAETMEAFRKMKVFDLAFSVNLCVLCASVGIGMCETTTTEAQRTQRFTEKKLKLSQYLILALIVNYSPDG